MSFVLADGIAFRLFEIARAGLSGGWLTSFSEGFPLARCGETSAMPEARLPRLSITAPMAPPRMAPTTASEAPGWDFLLEDSDEAFAADLDLAERFFMGTA